MSAAEFLANQLETRFGDTTTWAQHILDEFQAARFAVVELPNAEAVEDYGLYVSRAPHFGLPVGEEHDAGSRFRSIEETRRYAAVLLAIAATAEAEETDA